MPSAAPAFAGKSDAFIVSAANAWKILKDVKEKLEPLFTARDSLELANRAAAGELSAYNAGIEKIRVYARNQKDALAELARQDENYWMERSGADLLKSTAMISARACTDQWITNFANLKTLIERFLPDIQTAQSLLSDTRVNALRSAINETSLTALDGIALSQVVGDLRNSAHSIEQILRRIRNCRVAMR
jgi:hypothetical protein